MSVLKYMFPTLPFIVFTIVFVFIKYFVKFLDLEQSVAYICQDA